MLLPAAALQAFPRARALRSPLWIAVFMAAGVAALPLVPGVRGWMALSLLHAAKARETNEVTIEQRSAKGLSIAT